METDPLISALCVWLMQVYCLTDFTWKQIPVCWGEIGLNQEDFPVKHPVFCVLFPACHSSGAVPSNVLSKSLNFEFHLPSLMDSSDWACSSVGRVLALEIAQLVGCLLSMQ